MKVPTFVKYGFRIRTRSGMVVDNLMIHAFDEADAQRKLRQMYSGCEILECICHAGSTNGVPASYETVLELLVQ